MSGFKRFCSSIYERFFEVSPIALEVQLNMYCSLNELHVEFIEEIYKDFPDIRSRIDEHQQERAKRCCG